MTVTKRARSRWVPGALVAMLAAGASLSQEVLALGARDQNVGMWFSTNSQGRNIVFDMDGDGRRDTVGLNRHNRGGTPLYRGNPNGMFSLVRTFPQDDRHGGVAADFNGDNRQDIFYNLGSCSGRPAGACNNRVFHRELWLQQLGGGFTDVGPNSGASQPCDRGRDVVAFDADQDGRPDLALAAEGSQFCESRNRFIRNLGGGKFADQRSSPVARQIGSECVAAMKRRDGDYDLFYCADPKMTAQPGTWTFRGGAGVSFTNVTPKRAYRQIRARDIEFANVVGDAGLDLIVTSARRVAVWANVGDTFPRETYGLTIANGTDAEPCDVNRDGRPDIYVVNGRGGTINAPDTLLLNRGGGSFGRFAGLPQTRVGAGDSALCVQERRGGPLMVVQNGKNPFTGPNQTIVFSGS